MMIDGLNTTWIQETRGLHPTSRLSMSRTPTGPISTLTTPYFDRIGVDDWDTCFGLDRDNVVSKSDLGSAEYGHTLVCPSASTNAERFHLELNSVDFDFYWGSGSDYPNGEAHARGILTHEFGHAAGGWLDPFVGHWDQEGQVNLCQHNSSVEFHTMCSGVSKANSWKQATLESHDVHTFENAYPG